MESYFYVWNENEAKKSRKLGLSNFRFLTKAENVQKVRFRSPIIMSFHDVIDILVDVPSSSMIHNEKSYPISLSFDRPIRKLWPIFHHLLFNKTKHYFCPSRS